MNLLVKSAVIIDASSKHHNKKRDLLITNGVIEKIAASIPNTDERKEIKLNNLHISQGWFDSSVSFGEPGFEERETIKNGLKVAALSGFTSVALNPNTNPVVDSKADIEFVRSKAKGNAVSLYPVGALTQSSKGIDLAELYDMQQTGAIAFYDYQKSITNPNLLKLALQYTQSFNGLCIAFSNDRDIARNGVANEEVAATHLGLKGIPALAEELQVARNLFLLEYSGGKLHIPTLSTAKSVDLVRQAKKKGLNVSCSVAIHNLFLTDDALQDFDTHLKLLPPLRTESDQKALLKGLKDGTIDGVTSDHNPIDVEHKNVEFDHAMFGSIGLESCYGMLQKNCTTQEAIAYLTRLKDVFGIQAHTIDEGHKANLTFFDPDIKWTFTEDAIQSNSKNAVALRHQLKGKAYGIYANKKLKLNLT